MGVHVHAADERISRKEQVGFPTNQECFDEMVKDAMEKEYRTDENGEEVEVRRWATAMTACRWIFTPRHRNR
jgi:hypothetical protein